MVMDAPYWIDGPVPETPEGDGGYPEPWTETVEPLRIN